MRKKKKVYIFKSVCNNLLPHMLSGLFSNLLRNILRHLKTSI